MDPVMLGVVPGFIGGIVLALIFLRWQRPRPVSDVFSDAPATDVINMARIRVAGVGGLGLVAMAAVVAWAVPRIGRSLAVGLVLGALMAAAMIVLRRRRGPMASSSGAEGANTTLSIDK